MPFRASSVRPRDYGAAPDIVQETQHAAGSARRRANQLHFANMLTGLDGPHTVIAQQCGSLAMERRESQLTPVTGASVWTAAGMKGTGRWIYEVCSADIAELDRALAHVRAQALAIPFGKDQFPLYALAERLRALR